MRAQCFASDVTYNYDVLKNWDEDKVREFFENGGGGEGAAPSTKVLDIADAKDGVQTDPYAASMPDECLWRINADKTVAVVTLNRPAAKNAMDDKLTQGMMLAVARAKCTPSLRVLFITGNGGMFCAGGDPKGFQAAKAAADAAKASGETGDNANDASADAFANFLYDLNSLDCYVVALANGSAMGGGVGLLCCCDCVLARKTCYFALSEVKLGVIPATISPYVVAKIGPPNARRLFMTGETIPAEKALAMGLVQEVVTTPEELVKEAQKICDTLLLAAPGAVAAAKKLVMNVQYQPITKELQKYTANQLALVRATEESAGGMVAVQAGKKPPWASSPLTFPPA